MRIIVSGGGRSCSNWVRCVVTNTRRTFGSPVGEDRALPTSPRDLPEHYMAKLCIENDGVTLEMFMELMEANDDLHLVWCLRHPVAQAMAKMNRGTNKDTGEQRAIDSKKEDAVWWVKESARMYRELSEKYPDRVIGVKLEDLVVFGVDTVVSLFNFLGVWGLDERFIVGVLHSFSGTPNPHQLKRYGDKIDASQAFIYENRTTAYDGWFSDKRDVLEYLCEELDELIDELDYRD